MKTFRFTSMLLFGVTVAAMVLFSCTKADPDKPNNTPSTPSQPQQPTEVAVTGVSVSPETFELTVGESKTLSATVSPSNATNKNITWSSSNTSVATVADGKVTAVAAGEATIIVTTADGGKTANSKVKVNPKQSPSTPENPTVAVTSVSLDKAVAELTEGGTLTLVATVQPSNATNKDITWSSSNTAVATVSNGVVTAVSPGTATITVVTADGGKAATCAITVKARIYPVTSVSLNKASVELTAGETMTLAATVQPINATNKSVTWSSNNTAVVTVSNGVVTAVSSGTATITVVTTDGGKAATCAITVKSRTYPVTGVALNKTSAELLVGNSLVLSATISPSNATNKNVIWSSSNPLVATVSNGIVTAVSAGTTDVKVQTADGNFVAVCNVVVKVVTQGGNENVGENEGTWN